jgi:hypothetical protein
MKPYPLGWVRLAFTVAGPHTRVPRPTPDRVMRAPRHMPTGVQAVTADLPELRFGMTSGATPAPIGDQDGARRSRDFCQPASAPLLPLS